MREFCAGAAVQLRGKEGEDGGPPPAEGGGGSVMAHQVKKGLFEPERIVEVVRGEDRGKDAKGEQVQKDAHLGGDESVSWLQVGVKESVPK